MLKGATIRNLLQAVSPSRPAISPAPYRDQLRIRIKHIDIHRRNHVSQFPDHGPGRQLRAASRQPGGVSQRGCCWSGPLLRRTRQRQNHLPYQRSWQSRRHGFVPFRRDVRTPARCNRLCSRELYTHEIDHGRGVQERLDLLAGKLAHGIRIALPNTLRSITSCIEVFASCILRTEAITGFRRPAATRSSSARRSSISQPFDPMMFSSNDQM